MHIEHADDSDVVIDIREYRVNEAPDPKRSQMHLPPGTTVIRNDTVVEVTGTDTYLPEPVLFGRASEDTEDTETGREDGAPGVSATPLSAPAEEAAP